LIRINQFIGGLKNICVTNVNDYSSIVLEFVDSAFPWTSLFAEMMPMENNNDRNEEKEEIMKNFRESSEVAERELDSVSTTFCSNCEQDLLFKDDFNEEELEKYLDELEKNGEL